MFKHLMNAVVKHAENDCASWDKNLRETVYNTAVWDSSRHTPLEAMFGRTAQLPIDFNAIDNYDTTQQLMDYLDSNEPDNKFKGLQSSAVFMQKSKRTLRKCSGSRSNIMI